MLCYKPEQLIFPCVAVPTKTRWNNLKIKHLLKNQPELLKTSKENARHFWLILEVNVTWISWVILNLQQQQNGWVRKITIIRQKKRPVESSVWTLERLDIPNSLEKLEYAMPIIRETNKSMFCTYYKKWFLKDGLQDNHWVKH